jgi:hypothetical protein
VKAHGRKKQLTFGEFVQRVYDVCGKRKAGGIARLAIPLVMHDSTDRPEMGYSTEYQ